MDLDTLNRIEREAAVQALLGCCASEAWTVQMADKRPFADHDELLTAAADTWWTLGEEDWLQAFAAHPRIGEHAAGEDDHATWSRAEQAGTEGADTGTLEALAASNREYEARFGHVYLVVAAGRSAEQLLDQCRERLGNEPDEEFLIAAAEQATITEMRLRKLLGID